MFSVSSASSAVKLPLTLASEGYVPDTFFTASPHWTWFIIPYFYIGGIAGGAYFLAALFEWFGRPGDERLARLGYYVAAIGAALSGLILVVDLGKPLRFWHMLLQSNRIPLPILKAWSPMSIGSWALFVFGAFATISALGALATEGRGPAILRPLRFFHGGIPGRLFSAVGAFFGFFVAGYTGVLLDVSNRPLWADTSTLGLLFILSAGSTAAALLILLARWRGTAVGDVSIDFLNWFDGWALVLELLAIVLFLISLGEVASAWLSAWGAALLVLVIGLGILLPLALHYRPGWFHERWSRRHVVAAAVLVLLGGFFLRLVMVLASTSIGPVQSARLT